MRLCQSSYNINFWIKGKTKCSYKKTLELPRERPKRLCLKSSPFKFIDNSWDPTLFKCYTFIRQKNSPFQINVYIKTKRKKKKTPREQPLGKVETAGKWDKKKWNWKTKIHPQIENCGIFLTVAIGIFELYNSPTVTNAPILKFCMFDDFYLFLNFDKWSLF